MSTSQTLADEIKSVDSGAGLGTLRIARTIYDFAVDGGAVSTITPKKTVRLPKNAVIVGGTVDVTTSCTSAGSATIGVGTSAGSSTTALLAATAVASMGAGLKNAVPVFATPVKLTAVGDVTVTIATAALTAGVIEVTLLYFVANA